MAKGYVTGVRRAGSPFFLPLFLKISAELRGAVWGWGNGGKKCGRNFLSTHLKSLL